MTKKAKRARVSRHAAVTFHNAGRPFTDPVLQLTTAVMSMHLCAYTTASYDIRNLRRSNRAAFNVPDRRCPLHHGERLTYAKAQFRVQRERPAVKSGLNKPDTWRCDLARPVKHRLH
jgi:hypothetical protein